MMPLVVFLRGANVGRRRFSPKLVEAALVDVGLVNIGAAGTFIVRERIGEKLLRAKIEAELPFSPAPMMILKAEEIHAAFAVGQEISVPSAAKRFATFMDKLPENRPDLPLNSPAEAGWGVRIVSVNGRTALGLRRRVDETGVYPNETVERAFGVTATTRDWPTVEKLVKLLSA